MPRGDATIRAIAAYYRQPDPAGNHGHPDPVRSGPAKHAGRDYIVVRDQHAVLAVYRVRSWDGVLKRMKRWPIEIEGR
jgi:hypothetical protein